MLAYEEQTAGSDALIVTLYGSLLCVAPARNRCGAARAQLELTGISDGKNENAEIRISCCCWRRTRRGFRHGVAGGGAADRLHLFVAGHARRCPARRTRAPIRATALRSRARSMTARRSSRRSRPTRRARPSMPRTRRRFAARATRRHPGGEADYGECGGRRVAGERQAAGRARECRSAHLRPGADGYPSLPTLTNFFVMAGHSPRRRA